MRLHSSIITAALPPTVRHHIQWQTQPWRASATRIRIMSNRRHPTVPTISQVIPGATVNIVLKADQPTGRTVQGVVKDLLTRGNHPRGIKVRLADGRVGRVQTMASGTASSSAPPYAGEPSSIGGLAGGVQETGIEGYLESGGSYDPGYGSKSRPGRGGQRGGGGGNGSRGYEAEAGLPSQQIGLGAYLREAKPRRTGKGKGNTSTADVDDEDGEQAAASQTLSGIVTCPVCGTFEGDETAVAHHVATHFEASS